MKLRKPVQKPVPETIVALIDVVFFLLVFFMLVGRMDANAPFEVTPPYAETGGDMPAGGATISISEDGALALDGFAATADEIAAGITAQLAVTPDLLVRVNAHRTAELRHVLPLVAEMEALGVMDVVLVVTETVE
jgi:biopolymer transport protein ExbD